MRTKVTVRAALAAIVLWAAIVAPFAAIVAPSASASSGTSADPSTVEQALAGARGVREARLARLGELQVEIEGLLERYGRLERRAGRASLDLVTAWVAEADAERALAEAQERMDDRIRTAYELGPGGVLDALLGAPTFADLLTASEYASRTISVDAEEIAALAAAEAVLGARTAEAESARAAMAPRQRRLAGLLAELRATVNEAERLADRAGLRVIELERARRRIEDATARQIGRNLLGTSATGRDQSALLALLGPTGGRTCDTPEGLIDTGKSFEGYASWYGWEFGGQTTANGAIFDPRLFTAANRWLPFGTFLKVRYRDRCAIVLVNDRGPYGNLERVIDLSMASAHYLGVGVSWVRADILVPRDGIAS